MEQDAVLSGTLLATTPNGNPELKINVKDVVHEGCLGLKASRVPEQPALRTTGAVTIASSGAPAHNGSVVVTADRAPHRSWR